MSTAAPAKFFVNQGVVTSRADMQNLLRPTLKQTVTYRFMRGRDLIAHGSGWVERIVSDEPETAANEAREVLKLVLDGLRRG